MICVFPTLCENLATNGVDVREASRSIFLALNKTAKPVSRSRNLLLDDRDLISEFLREFLNEIKMDTTRADSLSIVNFEVDSQVDKVKLTSPLCISGVMHLYEVIERLMLTSETSYGLSSGSTRLGNIKKLHDMHSEYRLNTFEKFGETLISDELDRNSYGDTARDLLKEAFNERYVQILKDGFSKFTPYHVYIKAVDDFSGHLIANSMREIRDLLYDGQSGVSNLHAHHEELLEKVNSASSNQQFQRNLDIARGKIKLIGDQVEILKENIIRSFSKYPEREISPALFNAISEIYQNSFNTNAFQSAFFCTFFFTIEIRVFISSSSITSLQNKTQYI
jgi:hypothetical protein